MNSSTLVALVVVCTTACARGTQPPAKNAGRPSETMPTSTDFTQLDAYLSTWDQFAQGSNDLAAELSSRAPGFQGELAAALTAQDPRAPSRLVFYLVVQVGGFLSVDTPLGLAVGKLLGPAFPVVKHAGEPDRYFAGDIWFWWLDHRSHYANYALLDDWANREFARTVVLPMYQIARQAS